MRVAIYSRYSSDLQDPRSIADQIAAARDHAQRQGWTVCAEFQDAAISGSTTHNRPGLAELMRAAGAGRFDAVLTESLDRLSRDLEDIAGIHKRLEYAGVKIITLADGTVGKMHVGLKGMIASMFLDDLALKTRRGQVGRVKAGRIPGGKSYGYDLVPSLDERGQRTINEAEAAIVQRIFEEYVRGRKPIDIVSDLNRERAPSPRGGPWNVSTIIGSRKRANGLINNQLYIGKIVYNRQRFVKDPATGKRQARPNSPDQWIVNDALDLRIVSDALFAEAAARRDEKGGAKPTHHRRPKHLLSGLVRCGSCGASMIVIHRDYLGCSASRNRGTCDNRRTISTHEIESRILDVLRKYLLAPEVVAAAVDAYREHRTKLAKETERTKRDVQRDLAAVERKIAGVIAMVEAGGDPRTLAARLNEFVAEKDALEQRLPSKAADVIALHPNAAKFYADTVAQIHEALAKGDAAGLKAVALVRELVNEVVAIPTPGRDPMKLELVGNLAALLMEPSANQSPISMVAGAGFEPTTFRL
ncbi:Resolvase domain protein [Hyphomicrobium denitrificans ATCC 51888]|uniref:Resolvase domain protein n=1 Tax=Hyphomicrobium denitrificans (strain ATCC 51888 / DSM 1869 / NCIMB 11706 / TK 0415) TaxID=582899 RepID=D8JVH3_HYPDA|nr:Resolvase domain protein [Hyphomicrobium denitrificans ATCC 51888]